MAIKTGFWVKVENDVVVQCWDTPPPSDQTGWRDAVEVTPEVILNREYITTHSFDLTVEPAQIVWSKAEMTPEDRKSGLVGRANQAFQQVVQAEIKKQTDEFPETQYDAAVVEAARVVFEARRIAIDAATTHEEVDAL